MFWGTYLSSLASRISGPIYFVPLYAVVCIFAAVAIDHWWVRRRATAVVVLGVLAVATLPGAVTRFTVNQEISAEQEAWRASVDDLDEPALVFVADTGTYLLYANPFSSNAPDLDGAILYAAAGSPAMLDLIARQRERTPYLQEGSVSAHQFGPREDPYDLDVSVHPIDVVAGMDLELQIELTAPTGTESVDVRVATGVDSIAREVHVTSGSAPIVVALGGDGLEVGERGTVIVQADFRDAAGSTTSVRRVTPYRRASDHTIELLTPFVAERYEEIHDDTFQWRHVLALSDLTVTATRSAG